jgi:hypothetical protein
MSFITESKLKTYRPSYTSYKSNNTVLGEFRSESKYFKTKIFLSHKHDELEHLEGAISFLKRHGVEIYVDWLDDGMPKTTSGITAVRIKEKIKENDKFILLATEGAINSKWCNWELGLGDAAKYINNIAILPVKKDNSDFTGNEYLQIYPYIVNYDNYTYDFQRHWSPGSYVVFPDGEIVELKEWLKSK